MMSKKSLSYLMLILFVIAVAQSAVAEGNSGKTTKGSVALWGRFEAFVRNARPYSDPYRDISLNVSFTRPDGSTVKFWGFHDGADVWRIRFMPGQLGTWHYEAQFSDGALGIEGSFECETSGLPGMLTVDPDNPLWFGYSTGRPLLLRSLHVGDRFFADNWSDAKRTAFLDWAGKQGYNMLSVASHYLNRESEGRGEGWDTPDLWPPNPAEFGKLETILDDLSERRIMVFPFAGFFGRDSDFPRSAADQELYVRYVLARLGSYWNILLNVAGPEPNQGKKHFLSEDDVGRLGGLIKRLDVFGHPLSVHNATGDDPYKDSAWSTYGTLQGPKTVDRARLSSVLLGNHHPGKPLYAQETLWAGNKYHKELHSNTDLRKNVFVIQMSAAVLNFGDMEGNSSSGFSGSLELEQRNQDRHDIIKRVWDFFETVPFQTMKPRQDIVDQGYCLADPGREYLVYLESGGTVSVKVENGPYRVQWINAKDTNDLRFGGSTPNGTDLKAPEDGDDWLLRLRKRSRISR